MKNKGKELDVDFIGGQKPMTKEEELAISEFIFAHKAKRRPQNLRKAKLKTFRKDNNLPDKHKPPTWVLCKAGSTGQAGGKKIKANY